MRALVPCLVVVIAAALLGVPGTASGAVTIGANLDRPANATFTCSVIPAGGMLIPIGAETCTYFTTSSSLFSTSEGNIVPQAAGGYGVITKVRVKTGQVSGPMQVVTFRSMRQSQSTGEPGCCWPQYASAVFTPPAGAVTEVPTQLPVMNDTLLEAFLPMPGSALPSGPNTDPYGGVHEASTGLQGIQNYDQIALSILSSQATIPAHYDGDSQVMGGIFWPHLASRDMRILNLGQNGNGSSAVGAHLLLQAVWEPDTDRDGLGDETQDPQVGGPAQPAPAPQAGPDVTAPALTMKAARRRLRVLRSKGLPVTVGCNEACRISAKLLLRRADARRLHLAAAAKPVTVGTGRAVLTAPGKAKVTVKLTRRARRALARSRSVNLTLSVTATDAKGNAATQTSSLRFR